MASSDPFLLQEPRDVRQNRHDVFPPLIILNGYSEGKDMLN